MGWTVGIDFTITFKLYPCFLDDGAIKAMEEELSDAEC
jgi:hypothetical protein